MKNFKIRTEDFKSEEIDEIYVETKQDRDTIEYLKSDHQLLLVGSRGVGKTMLLRVAEKELSTSYNKNRVLPVYMSFIKGILVNRKLKNDNFRHWMISKLLSAFRSSMMKKGIITQYNNPFAMLFKNDSIEYNSLDRFIELLERTWDKEIEFDRKKVVEILGIDDRNYRIINEVDFVKEVIEQFCKEYHINKVLLLFDEACHNFIPEQQREFFTMFRDLRSPYICCKAAVYPGITYYSTIQIFHDVITRRVERNIFDDDYIEKMREIVRNQVNPDTYKIFEQNGKEFNALIYCSSGNPRLLLKSLELASDNFKSLKRNNVNETIKNFYRVKIWDEHSKLSEIYKGHKFLIDWGRNFLEDSVLIETNKKNETRKPSQSIFFAIHRDSPERIKRAVKILEYSGIVTMQTAGTKVRGEIYDRYQINFGIVVSNESNKVIVNRCHQLYSGLSVKMYTEYGKNSPAYRQLINGPVIGNNCEDVNEILKFMLKKSIDILDITDYQKCRLKEINIHTLYDILSNDESNLQDAYQIGPIRSRQIYNVAYNAAVEYISG